MVTSVASSIRMATGAGEQTRVPAMRSPPMVSGPDPARRPDPEAAHLEPRHAPDIDGRPGVRGWRRQDGLERDLGGEVDVVEPWRRCAATRDTGRGRPRSGRPAERHRGRPGCAGTCASARRSRREPPGRRHRPSPRAARRSWAARHATAGAGHAMQRQQGTQEQAAPAAARSWQRAQASSPWPPSDGPAGTAAR